VGVSIGLCIHRVIVYLASRPCHAVRRSQTPRMHRHQGQNAQRLHSQRQMRSQTGHCPHLRRFLFSFSTHLSHIKSKKRTRPNIDKPIGTMMFSAILPFRRKTKIGRLTGGSDIERTAVNVPSSGLSTCTRICLRSRAIGISKSRAGIAAMTTVPLIVKAQSKSRS
jgi:hypothetical protein